MDRPLEIVIVGGGTAGWMTAAALSHVLTPALSRIRLIESEEIGSVGVGEATLPQIRAFNRWIGVDETEMMRASYGTFKLGIEFVDWGFEGSRFIHPFGAYGTARAGVPFHHHWARAAAHGPVPPLEHFSLAVQAARRNRFDVPAPDPRVLRSTYDYAYHFDAGLYARHLRTRSEAAGVRRTEGKVVDVSLNGETGDVAAVTLESGERINGDLFIDCSGFRALLIGKALGATFEEWTNWLPCDRAFAVPSERLEALPPFTQSIAHQAGWQWRIALQHRTGNGLVYSSAFIGDDEAASTLMNHLPSAALGEPRMLRFVTGRRVGSWSRNCVAIGLSSGFLEPLESTSIYLIQVGIANLVSLFPDRLIDPALPAEFNRRMDVEYERIRDFLILHYHLNRREDGEMWRHCRAMEVPESLSRRMEMFVHRGHIDEYREGLFSPPSWLSVLSGQGLGQRGWHAMAESIPIERLTADLEAMECAVAEAAEAMPSHDDYIRRHCAVPELGQ